MEPGGIEPTVHVSQYDAGSRTLLFDFGPSYSIPSGASVSIRGTKPDKTGFAYPCTIASGKASVVVQDQMTVCAGRVPCEVRIEVDGTRIHSATFVLDVKPSALDDTTVISDSELSLLETAGNSAFTGATASADGSTGLVPKPTIADAGKYLCGDGTWKAVSGGTGTSDKPVEVDVELSTAVTSGKVTVYRIGHLLHIDAENLSVKWGSWGPVVFIFTTPKIGGFSVKGGTAMWGAVGSDHTLKDFGFAAADATNDGASLEVMLVGKADSSQTGLYFSMTVPLLDS